MSLTDLVKNAGTYLSQGVSWVWRNLVPNQIKAKLITQLGTSSPGIKEILVAGIASIFQLFLSWYFYIIVISLIVLSRLFDALKNTGILDKFTAIVYKATDGVLRISNECFPLLGNYQDFINCIMK